MQQVPVIGTFILFVVARVYPECEWIHFLRNYSKTELLLLFSYPTTTILKVCAVNWSNHASNHGSENDEQHRCTGPGGLNCFEVE